MSPNQVTVLGAVVGMAGGVLFYDVSDAPIGFMLLLLHGLLDSADGQLARLTGRTSELGRVLDGIGGYVTHIALYTAIAAGAVARGSSPAVWGLAVAAGLSTIAHAQMYDYHRTVYIDVVLKGRAVDANAPRGARGWLRAVLAVYGRTQRLLVGEHDAVAAALAARGAGAVREEDRERYRRFFHSRVHGWNALGDNGRRFAAGACAFTGHLLWYFWFEAIAMNVVLAGLWFWQRRTDRQFLADL
jgi:hypothetical protein